MDARTTTSMTPTPPSGCEASSPQDTSLQATSTSDQSKMSPQTTCADTRNATSLQALADGVTHFALPDGRIVDRFGLAAALASLSHRQVAAMGLRTVGICGPRSRTSSKSERLESCLVSRLLDRLDVNGSPEYVLTWKQWVMPARPSIFALRASPRRTSDSGLCGWATPMARDHKHGKFTPQGKAKRDSHTRGKSLSEQVGHTPAGSWDSQPRGTTARLRQRDRAATRRGVHRRVHRSAR